MADLFQFIDNIDADKQAMVIKRLENRAQMPKFAAIRENYFDKIGLPVTGRIHELGCGTGAVCRAIASRPGFLGTVVGSDLQLVCTEKLDSDVLVMKPADQVMRHDAANPLNRARDRRIFVQ